MTRLTHPNGSVLFIQRPREVQAFLANQPRVLPIAPQAPGLSNRVLVALARLFFIVLALVIMAALFFLFGEDRTRQVQRPLLTPAQRANAFRI